MKILGLVGLLISALLVGYLTLRSQQSATTSLNGALNDPSVTTSSTAGPTPAQQLQALQKQLNVQQQQAAARHSELDEHTQRELAQ